MSHNRPVRICAYGINNVNIARRRAYLIKMFVSLKKLYATIDNHNRLYKLISSLNGNFNRLRDDNSKIKKIGII